MSSQKVLFISQEITPYLPQTPMSEINRLLPQKVQEKGFEVRMFMPKYGCIIKVATLQSSRMQVYFIDNDDYFQRHPASELEIVSHPEDNDERSIFFVRGVAETVKKLRWDPVVIHCSGWVTALTPLYLKHIYNEDPSFRGAKVIYSLFDDAFDGTFDPQMLKKLKDDSLPDKYLTAIKNGDIDHCAINRLAIDHADAIVQARENVSPELIEYAIKSGKPFLPYPGEGVESMAAYTDFYDTILSGAK